jgi:hypothetical protein
MAAASVRQITSFSVTTILPRHIKIIIFDIEWSLRNRPADFSLNLLG